MIKINRKANGEIIGLPVFFGREIIEKFAEIKTTHLEVKKTVKAEGIMVEFQPIKAEATGG